MPNTDVQQPVCLTNPTLVALLENSFQRFTERPAIDALDGPITFGQLDQLTKFLAGQLQAQFSQAELKARPIALSMSRSAELYISQIAVLRAGGFFLTIDLKQPPQRLEYLLSDSQALILLRRRGDTACSNDQQVPLQVDQLLVDLGELQKSIDDQFEITFENHPICETELAYLVYTSGSTGNPKGVPIHHSAVWHLINWCVSTYKKSPVDRALQFTSPGFDVGAEEVFATLAAGACLVPLNASVLHSVEEFLNWVKRKQISVLQIPTAFWEVVATALQNYSLPSSVRLVIFGGESVRPAAVEQWFESVGDRVTLVNAYGPTEATVTASHLTLKAGEPVTIGKPVSYLEFYVVDADGKLVHDDAVGELYIAGASVATKYWNREELTAERFVHPDFAPGSLCYKTGDRVRRLADGQYEMLGRLDDQVKIRGHRIEPDEIANTLSSHPGVSQAFVRPFQLGPSKQLVAYATLQLGAHQDVGELNRYLKDRLPPYMVPARMMILDSFPLTPRGKIDRAKLPDPIVNEARNNQRSTLESPTQQSVAKIWQTVLGTRVNSPSDHFFELGGDSLGAIDLVLRIKQEFGLVVPVAVLIPNPTIKGLADFIDDHLNSADNNAAPTNSRSPHVTRLVDPSASEQVVYLHAAGGGGVFYRDLYQVLTKPHSALILESPCLYDADLDAASLGNVSDVAEAYIEAMLKHGFKDNLTLVGYSFGGLLAVEMASQLNQMGIKVKKIVNIDAPNRQRIVRRSLMGRILMNFQKLTRPIRLIRQLQKSQVTVQGLKKIRQLQQRNEAIPVKYRSLAVELIYREMQDRHSAAHFDGTMYLIRSTDEESKICIPEDYGWGDYVKTLQITKVPGDHLSIFHQPWLSGLQKAFQKVMEGDESV